jgi:hypothetical protein
MEPLTWYFVAGIVLCAMAIAATLIRRLQHAGKVAHLTHARRQELCCFKRG